MCQIGPHPCRFVLIHQIYVLACNNRAGIVELFLDDIKLGRTQATNFGVTLPILHAFFERLAFLCLGIEFSNELLRHSRQFGILRRSCRLIGQRSLQALCRGQLLIHK